ncbi:cytochrome P450 [Oligoflexus tunisiensis]|uniref:cytochrome P450 n=1 Tax=Oligoflexus tunisiensis TaxID=708132 RepID=UPI00114CC56B|nr:cytochrome P450 [Oligoflexus tunisiensis]
MIADRLLNVVRPKTPDFVPGPRYYTPLKFLNEMNRDPLGFLTRMQKEYGDVVRMPFALAPIYLVTQPDLLGRILLNTEKNNRKSLGYRRLKPLLGEGLLTSGGDLWRTQRRLANPEFHQKAIHGFFDVVQEECLKLVEELDQRIKTNPLVNISDEMSRLTFTIIVRILFSINMHDRAQDVKQALRVLQDYAHFLFYSVWTLPMTVPTPGNLKAKKAIQDLDQIVYQIISEHRAHPDRYQDLLSQYLKSVDEESGTGMTDKLLRDEVTTLMLAGHETTAITLSYAFELLAKNPRCVENLNLEYAALPQSTLSMSDLPNLEYTQNVFSEAMRLYPAAWAIGREATEDIEFQDYRFASGSTFICVQYLTHRHPKYWPRPEVFRPERFSAEESKGRHPFAYFPFGAGQRSCIGSSLARFEAQIILATLMRHFKMEAVKDAPYTIKPLITLVADPGITLRLSRR